MRKHGYGSTLYNSNGDVERLDVVMTTVFTSVMDKLPPTAYIKMVDVWLIFGQLIPFLETVLLTVMEYLREGENGNPQVREWSRALRVQRILRQVINHHGTMRAVLDDDSRTVSAASMNLVS